MPNCASVDVYLIHVPHTLQQALAVQHWLALRDVQVVLQASPETPSARMLRASPELTLIYDEQGLWLAAQGMKMQPDWAGQLMRLYRAGIKNELLARACLAVPAARVIDATAGLGHDALLLAWLGAEMVLLERHPVLAALLLDAKQQAMQHADVRLQQTLARMTVVYTASEVYLADCAIHQSVDVVYLDPMFPKPVSDKKQPLVKKEMQILQHLFKLELDHAVVNDTGDALLPLAMRVARRVIVKRPKLAPPLAMLEPDHRWLGDACRFDGYFQLPSGTQASSATVDLPPESLC